MNESRRHSGAVTSRARGLLKIVCTLLVICAAITSVRSSHAEALVIEGRDGWLFPGWESLTAVDKPGIDANIALLQKVRDRLAARNVGLVVLVVPMKAPLYPERLPAGLAVSDDVRGRYPAILSALARADIRTIDDQPVLGSVETGAQIAFYRADYHWSAWSAEATATAVADLIRKNWKLSGADGTGMVLGEWISERNYGDLAANFLTREKRKAIGRDVYPMRTPATDRTDLLDKAAAPVHVIGNSFVQPTLGFSQKLSSAIDRPVSLTWNPGNIGPWATLLEYVSSTEFARQKPQVIVWQFNEGQMHLGPAASRQWDAKVVLAEGTWLARVSAAITGQ